MQWSGIIISAMRSNRDLLKLFNVSSPEEYERPGKELSQRDILVWYMPHLLFPRWPLIAQSPCPSAAQSMPWAHMNSKVSVFHLLKGKAVEFSYFSNFLTSEPPSETARPHLFPLPPFLWQFHEVTAFSNSCQLLTLSITGSTRTGKTRETLIVIFSFPPFSFLGVSCCAMHSVVSS